MKGDESKQPRILHIISTEYEQVGIQTAALSTYNNHRHIYRVLEGVGIIGNIFLFFYQNHTITNTFITCCASSHHQMEE